MFDGTADTGSISTEAKFCENCPWGKTDFNKNMVKCPVSLSLCQFFLSPVTQHGQAAASELPRLCPLHRPGRGAVWRWGHVDTYRYVDIHIHVFVDVYIFRYAYAIFTLHLPIYFINVKVVTGV